MHIPELALTSEKPRYDELDYFPPLPHPTAGRCGDVAGAWEKWQLKEFTGDIKVSKEQEGHREN